MNENIEPMALFNCYVWMVWPELFYAVIWKLDIFVILLFTPLIYATRSGEKE